LGQKSGSSAVSRIVHALYARRLGLDHATTPDTDPEDA